MGIAGVWREGDLGAEAIAWAAQTEHLHIPSLTCLQTLPGLRSYPPSFKANMCQILGLSDAVDNGPILYFPYLGCPCLIT